MTVEAAGRAAAGEAGFRLPAEQLPDIVMRAFDEELEIWAATGAAIRARAKSACNRALVAIEGTGSGVVLRVSDDGRGFDPDHVQVLADIAHFGLIAMRERVEARLPLTDPSQRLRL